jgi:hypothetical protein
MRQRFGRVDGGSSRELSDARGENPDRSAAKYGHTATEVEMTEINGVDGDTQRFSDGANRQGHARREREEQVTRMDDELLKRAGHRRTAEEAQILAEVGIAFHAEPTFPAVDGRVDGNRRAWRRTRRPRPKSLNHSSYLMSENMAGVELEIPNPALRVVLKIRTADSHCFNAHQGFARSG